MTDDPAISDHDRVTADDIADLLHHLADLRYRGRSDDPDERSAFLARKAELLSRIADQHTDADPGHPDQVRQMASDALTAANQAGPPHATHQRVGPPHRRTTGLLTDTGGATSQEQTGASPG